MKKTTYTCNLCREKVDKTNVFCWYFRSAPLPQTYVLIDNQDASDVHMCKSCLEILKKHLTKIVV